MTLPAVFIGSSSEGLEFARAVRGLLSQDAEITLWNEDFFGLGTTFIEALITNLARFDFAILVFTPDDIVNSRQDETLGPRDNVIFELGLFMGHLGRNRTYIVYQANADIKIPTDLAGLVMASYHWPRADGNYQAAVGAACDTMRKNIRDLGISDAKAGKMISHIESRQLRTEAQVRTLQLLVKGLVSEFEYDKLRGLAAAGPFLVRYHNDMLNELKRLDALRYVQPQRGYGLESIRERDGRGDEFDLKQYVYITPEGVEYLKLRQELNNPALDSEIQTPPVKG